LFIREAHLDPMEIERPFSIPLVNIENGDTLPVRLVGIVDLVDRPNGIPRPLEIKTRARRAEEWLIRTALELTCYAWWVRQEIMAASREESDEIPVGYIHIIKTKTPSIQWQTDTRTVEDFLELYRTAEAVQNGICERRFYRNPGTHCNWCDFPSVCGKKRDEVVRIFGEAARLRLWEADLI
jgi:CRISPR/Cas system-associated exonuclease Cas4 (RecB family)